MLPFPFSTEQFFHTCRNCIWVGSQFIRTYIKWSQAFQYWPGVMQNPMTVVSSVIPPESVITAAALFHQVVEFQIAKGIDLQKTWMIQP